MQPQIELLQPAVTALVLSMKGWTVLSPHHIQGNEGQVAFADSLVLQGLVAGIIHF